MLGDEAPPGNFGRRGAGERGLHVHDRRAPPVRGAPYHLVHRLGRPEAELVAVLGAQVKRTRDGGSPRRIEPARGTVEGGRVGAVPGGHPGQRLAGVPFVPPLDGRQRGLRRPLPLPALHARIGAADERRLVAFVAHQGGDQHRDPGPPIARQQVLEVATKLVDPPLVQARAVGNRALPDHPLHLRPRRRLRPGAQPSPEPGQPVPQELHGPQPTQRQVGAHQGAPATHRLRRPDPQDAVVLVVSGVDEHGVGLDRDDLVGEVQQRVGVHRGHGRVHDLDLALGEGALEPSLQHAGERAPVEVRVAERRGAPLHDEAKRLRRLLPPEDVPRDARHDRVSEEVAVTHPRVHAQVAVGGPGFDEERVAAPEADQPEGPLEAQQEEEGNGQGDGREQAAPRGGDRSPGVPARSASRSGPRAPPGGLLPVPLHAPRYARGRTGILARARRSRCHRKVRARRLPAPEPPGRLHARRDPGGRGAARALDGPPGERRATIRTDRCRRS